MKDEILNKINKSEIKMTSKKYFLLKWLTLLSLSAFFGLLSIYIFAFIVFFVCADNDVIMKIDNAPIITDFKIVFFILIYFSL